MRGSLIAAAVAALGFLASAGVQAPADNSMMMSPRDRAMYIVTRLGMCSDCHGADFHGSMLPFVPAPGVKMPWAAKAPSIAGLRMFKSDAAAVRFLETGVLPGGGHARPPMPEYRMKSEDAHAVVMYLRSLK